MVQDINQILKNNSLPRNSDQITLDPDCPEENYLGDEYISEPHQDFSEISQTIDKDTGIGLQANCASHPDNSLNQDNEAPDNIDT
jgi:hypothetical protein